MRRYPQSIGYEGRYNPQRGFHQITKSPSTNRWYDRSIPKMNLDRFLELGEGVINKKFTTWTEMVGTARVNVGFEVRLMGEEGDNFSSNEDMYIVVVVVRRELCVDAGDVGCSMLWFRGGSNLSNVGGGQLLLMILPRILPLCGPILQILLLLTVAPLLGLRQRLRQLGLTSSEHRVSMFSTSDATIILHELGGDDGGGEWSGVGSRLEEDNNDGLPGGVLGK